MPNKPEHGTPCSICRYWTYCCLLYPQQATDQRTEDTVQLSAQSTSACRQCLDGCTPFDTGRILAFSIPEACSRQQSLALCLSMLSIKGVALWTAAHWAEAAAHLKRLNGVCVQGIAKLEGEMQAVRALLGNSSNIVAALREIATPSGAAR